MTNLYDIKKGKKESVVDFIDTRFKKHRENMQDLYRSWMLNLAWTRGYQNVDFDRIDKKFKTTNAQQPWKVRLISNLMLPIVRRIVAQMSYIHPVWDVIPATSDEEDIHIAETQTKVLQDVWQRVDLNQKLIRLLFWQSTCSSAFLKVGWDADAGDEMEVNPKDVNEELLKQFLEYQGLSITPETLKVNAGELFVDVVPPFNITFDDSVAVMEDSQWIIESQIRSKDWLVDKYGNKYKDIPETEEQELFLYPFIYGQSSGRIKKNGVLVHELFVKRTKKFKEGLYCLVAGSEIIISPREHLYDHKELPYGHFVEIYDPASVWGTCAVEQIRPNQARYNRVSSGVMEQINQMSNLQWLNPKNSGVKQFTNRPGQVLHYNYPQKPEQVSLRPIPAYVDRMLDRTRLDMQDTSSTHDVSEAKAEPGVRSGRAVLALQDADDSVLGPTLLWFDETLIRVGRLALQTLAQHITEERQIEVVGDFNELEVLTFNSDNLKGKSHKANYWKVRVKTYGRQAMSRSGREGLTRTLLELRLLDPQIHREELLQIMGAADILSVYDRNSIDRVRQFKEIQMMMQGQPVIAHLGQNHTVHIDSIKKCIASSKWDKIDEKVKGKILEHLMQHMQLQVDETIFPQVYMASKLGPTNGTGSQTNTNGQGSRQPSGVTR